MKTPHTNCLTCGLPVIEPDEFDPNTQGYADTPGGHADRHTQVLEAAERAAREGAP